MKRGDKKAIVIGATGLVGQALVERLQQSDDFSSITVVVRKNSDTFGKWEAVILSGENKKQFFVPPGFAHGFMVLEDETIFCYKCTEFYSPEYDSGIIWNDLDLDIKWPIDEIGELSLSQKDMSLQTFKEFLNKENPF